MKEIETIGSFVYGYCTDFIINLANILGSSYYEINLYIFCILYPLLLAITFTTFLVQSVRLRKARKQLRNQSNIG